MLLPVPPSATAPLNPYWDSEKLSSFSYFVIVLSMILARMFFHKISFASILVRMFVWCIFIFPWNGTSIPENPNRQLQEFLNKRFPTILKCFPFQGGFTERYKCLIEFGPFLNMAQEKLGNISSLRNRSNSIFIKFSIRTVLKCSFERDIEFLSGQHGEFLHRKKSRSNSACSRTINYSTIHWVLVCKTQKSAQWRKLHNPK